MDRALYFGYSNKVNILYQIAESLNYVISDQWLTILLFNWEPVKHATNIEALSALFSLRRSHRDREVITHWQFTSQNSFSWPVFRWNNGCVSDNSCGCVINRQVHWFIYQLKCSIAYKQVLAFIKNKIITLLSIRLPISSNSWNSNCLLPTI